jgi:plastocyanin
MLLMSVSADAATIQISMVISPAEATVKVGDTVEWINKDVFRTPQPRVTATGT